jgi:ribosomal protein S18 acetylase RimI-like enzyme
MTGSAGYSIRRVASSDVDAVQALMFRVVEEDFLSTYDPALHRDIDDIVGTYMTPERHVLFVAIDDATGAVIGTAGARDGTLHRGPDHLVARYGGGTTAQLVRVYVRREDRRRGVARALLASVARFIIEDGGYSTISLHTFPHSPGALAFWESVGTKVWAYEREGQYPQVFFEITLERARELAEA